MGAKLGLEGGKGGLAIPKPDRSAANGDTDRHGVNYGISGGYSG